MAWPLVAPAPVVTAHAAAFRDLFDHPCQFRHVQHDLTGLIILPNKRLATIARCLLDRADTTHLSSRVLSEAPWQEDEVKRRRESLVVIDETLCEHVGSLFDDVDRHDNHRDGTYPMAHNPVTSVSVSGPVRFPVGLRRYRRYEALTQWQACVATHVPDLTIPPDAKARHRLHTQVDSVWLQDPAYRARHAPFRTNIVLAIDLVEAAIRGNVPVGVVVFDAWYLAEDVVRVLARRRQDWISRLNKNRGLETASLQRRDANGWTMTRPGPHLAGEDLVPLIPATAYRSVTVREHTYGCFTLVVRIPSLGQGRLVVSFEQESLTGRSVVLVTNRLDWSVTKIISLDWQRWPTDTCDQDGKGHLGFNDYRLRSAEAIGNHWCLVFVAYALWRLTCLPTVPDRTKRLIHTTGDACRQQGRALLQKLLVFVHDQLSQGGTVDQVFARLCAKQGGMVPA